MGSLTPALFADAFASAGINGFYHPMDVDRLPGRRLGQLLDAMKTVGCAGSNITLPFKQDIHRLRCEEFAGRQVGVINTVAIAPDGRTTGYNFDRIGFRRSFEESFGRSSAENATVVQVGAGGAGRAVAFAMMDLGVATLIIHDSDGARANAIMSDLATYFGAARCRITSDLERDIASEDRGLNVTQVGMRGFPGNPVARLARRSSTGWPT